MSSIKIYSYLIAHSKPELPVYGFVFIDHRHPTNKGMGCNYMFDNARGRRQHT